MPDGREDRILLHRVPGVHHLNRALAQELLHPLLELLILSSVRVSQVREELGGERGNRRQHLPRAHVERVADRERAGVVQADDVAGEPLVEHRLVLPEHLRRAREQHRLFRPRVGHPHPALEPAADDANERHLVPVSRVHVRLKLEHEAGEALVRGLDAVAAEKVPAPRSHRVPEERVEEELHAEIVHAGTEEDRRELAVVHRLKVELAAELVQQLDVLHELRVELGADERLELLVVDG